jgi:hypothetical protein
MLAGLGYSQDDIAKLRAEGAIRSIAPAAHRASRQ